MVMFFKKARIDECPFKAGMHFTLLAWKDRTLKATREEDITYWKGRAHGCPPVTG